MRQHDFWDRLTKVVEVVGAMSNLDQFGVRYKNKPLSPQTLHRTCLKELTEAVFKHTIKIGLN